MSIHPALIMPDRNSTLAYPELISEGLSPLLSIIIPAYNEAATLESVVLRVSALPYPLEVLIIDDGSTDQTPTIGQNLSQKFTSVRYFKHEQNSGKTAALKTGFSLSRGQIVLVQDADLEYDPSEIPDLIQPILDGKADVVFGSRFLVKKAARVLYFYHYLANQLLTFLSDLFTNLNMTDVETGYKAFRGDIIRNMKIVSSGFGFEIEVTAKVAKLNVAVYEVPISYYGRTYDEGKKIGFMDGVAALWYILRFNLFTSLKNSYHQLPPPRSSQTLSLTSSSQNIQSP